MVDSKEDNQGLSQLGAKEESFSWSPMVYETVLSHDRLARTPWKRFGEEDSARNSKASPDSMLRISDIFKENDQHSRGTKRRRTKIVCSIGPSSRSVDTLEKLLDAGMNVARLNFSHGDHDYHRQTLRNIKEAVRRRQARGLQSHCAILMDTKGPEIRTGFLKDHTPIQLRAGQYLDITTDYTIKGDNTVISCNYKNLCTCAYLGGEILMADGSVSCVVTSIDKDKVQVRVLNNATLGERKNMNIRNVRIGLDSITSKDKYDLENFALKHDVDIISGSFIRTAANVQYIRKFLGEKGRRIRVHAKIESVEGLRNLEEIIKEADGIHVSRGDLGMELPMSLLFLAQKTIIHTANFYGKPVVTSTQMLHSMTTNSRPTLAECGDVGNAVLDGTDGVMLSGETANGRYPVESVETMSRIIAEAEVALDFENSFSHIRNRVLEKLQVGGSHISIMEALASSAVECALDTNSPLIVLMSETGVLPLLVAKYRPPARILVATTNSMTARQMCVSRGINSYLIVSPEQPNSRVDVWMQIGGYIWSRRWAQPSDRIVLVASPFDGDESVQLNQTGDAGFTYLCRSQLLNCVEIREFQIPSSKAFKKG